MIINILLGSKVVLSKNKIRDQLHVAIIDTGINLDKIKVKICKDGLMDLTKKGIEDSIGHGTNISGIISEGLENIDYCLIIIKYFIPKDTEGNFLRARDAFIWLSRNSEYVDIINMSGGGTGGDYSEEYRINYLLDRGVIIVAAAGNEGKDLNKICYFYPACYDKRIIVVGNGDPDKKTLYPSSNYGKIVDVIANGINVCSGGHCFTGTSQATAKVTNWIIKNYRRVENEQKDRREKRSDSKRK